MERGWRTAKRPGLNSLLAHLSRFYEIVLFTSAQVTYAGPIVDRIDPSGYIMYRLYRDATKFVNNHHVKVIARVLCSLASCSLFSDRISAPSIAISAA
jgi:mitochondrial import inner membrane translocase subunit TIM50